MTVKSRIRIWIAGVAIAMTIVIIQAGADMAALVGQRQALTAASMDLAAISRYDARIAASEDGWLEPTDPSWAAWTAMAGPAAESVGQARQWLDRIDHVALGAARGARTGDLRWYVRKAAAELRAASASLSNAAAQSWADISRSALLAYVLLFAGATGVFLLRGVPTAGITVITTRAARRRRKLIPSIPGLALDHVRHELRTPLTVLLGYAAELESQLDGELKTFAATIRESGNRLHQTMEELLTYAELTDSGTPLRSERLEIHSVVERVIRSMRPHAFEKRLSFVYRATKNEAWVHANPEAIETAVSHLVDNAIKYTESGSVLVTVEAEGDRVRVAVEDTGMGFEEGRLEHLTSPFEQGSSGDTRDHQGVGLGLTIARRVAEASDGRLTASSLPEVGSRFTLTLPRLAEEAGLSKAA